MLREFTISAVMAFARAPAVDTEAERPRLESFAADIAGAVDARHDLAHWLPGSVLPLPVRSGDARARTALALVAIAFHESAFNAAVSDCRRVGSFDPAITAFQLWGPFARGLHTAEELCASPRLAAERALYVLAHHARRCGSIERAFHGYASGDCGRPTRAGRELIALWHRALQRAKLD